MFFLSHYLGLSFSTRSEPLPTIYNQATFLLQLFCVTILCSEISGASNLLVFLLSVAAYLHCLKPRDPLIPPLLSDTSSGYGTWSKMLSQHMFVTMDSSHLCLALQCHVPFQWGNIRGAELG